MAYGLDTYSFLKAFFRMINRLGYPIELVSDNAGKFSMVENGLKDLCGLKLIIKNLLKSCFTNHRMTWSFISPLSPGGVQCISDDQIC